ncbi:MAG: sulfide/dihydroorotate dehydrogenase-like FAD/NAD-binding protein [Candidatus Gastranaerophilales bacterium]|nr:sulfide/dihydroorotate dehydrogenase-like FAD/NAD-binding protein [Candidatus Gastranaerophilales bacterium]
MGYEILYKKELCKNQYEIRVKAPFITKNAKAGQFIILRTDKNSERIPLTIADYDRQNEILTIVYMAVGYTTKKLASLDVGDEIEDIVGPLGVPTHIKNYGTVICVAGGYGAAPCYLIAKAFKEAGNKVHMVMGARTKDLIFWQDKMKNACEELHITTDDGTLGTKGFTTQVAKDIIDSEKVDYVIAVGPMPMMRAVAELTRPYGIKTEASMNPIMVDGTGMCGACRVTVGGEVKFACVDGPDFDAHLIDFDEVINRTRIYKEEEKRCDETKCNLIKKGIELEKSMV